MYYLKNLKVIERIITTKEIQQAMQNLSPENPVSENEVSDNRNDGFFCFFFYAVECDTRSEFEMQGGKKLDDDSCGGMNSSQHIISDKANNNIITQRIKQEVIQVCNPVHRKIIEGVVVVL